MTVYTWRKLYPNYRDRIRFMSRYATSFLMKRQLEHMSLIPKE